MTGVTVAAAGLAATGLVVVGWWSCARLHGLRRCGGCGHRSEIYEDHTGRRRCGWCWLRDTGQTDRLLGVGQRRR